MSALAIASRTRANGAKYATDQAERFQARFPTSVSRVLLDDVCPLLPPSLSAYLTTTNPVASPVNPDKVWEAAQELGVLEILAHEGPGRGFRIDLPPTVLHWRTHRPQRIFLDCCMLAGVPDHVVLGDIQRLWSLEADEESLGQYRALFADRSRCGLSDWDLYARCIPDREEADLKRKLCDQPHSFIRWRLGVPVDLEENVVLDRLISDAYFSERLLKANSGDMGLRLTKDEVARIKLERDTIFKGLDRKQKIQAARGGGGDGEATARALKALEQLVVEPEEVPMRSLEDIRGDG